MASRQEKGDFCRGAGCFRAEMRRYGETRLYPYGAGSSSDFRLQEDGVDIFGETSAVLQRYETWFFTLKILTDGFIFLKIIRGKFLCELPVMNIKLF